MDASTSRPLRTLVTGASGYIGQQLVRRLVAEGWDVHVLMRAKADRTLPWPAGGRVDVHVHDGSTASISAIVGESRPDVVFHLASLFLVQHQPGDASSLIESNVLFPTQLVEAMAAHDIRHLVNTGTSWQHHHGADYLPVNLYAATKQAFEDVLAYYCDAHGLGVKTLALFDTYGPGDSRKKLIPLLWQAAASGIPLQLSPGEQRLDMVHVDDVIDAFVLAARQLSAQGAMHARHGVSSGRTLTLRELVAAFERATGEQVPVVWGGRPYRPREVMVPWGRSEPLPGWTARIAFEDGVAQTRPRPDDSPA